MQRGGGARLELRIPSPRDESAGGIRRQHHVEPKRINSDCRTWQNAPTTAARRPSIQGTGEVNAELKERADKSLSTENR